MCVLGSADISSNVADISGGFEDLIPSVFEELLAALLAAQRRMLEQNWQQGPAFRALVSAAFGAARPHSPIKKTCIAHCMPFRDDGFTVWSLA